MRPLSIPCTGLRSGFILFLFLCGICLRTPAAEINLLCFGDWGYGGVTEQHATATAMADYGKTVKFDAALLLGDNFYKKMPGGVNDPRWQAEFEKMYDPVALPMPFYVALGNHDYEQDKAEVELNYAKQNPNSRWKMPAKYYRVEIPAENPVVSVLVLDSNEKLVGAQAWKEELAWIERELAKPRPGKWTIAVAHHPVFSNSSHGDTPEILRDWEPLFAKHKLDFYLCGHDHCLEHLQVAGHHTTYIVSGGGGAKSYAMRRDDRGPFTKSQHSFLHLALGAESANGKLVSANGQIAHEFKRELNGKVTLIKNGGVEKKSLLPKSKKADE